VPVLEGSVSAIALPIVYADQLHGVLYVETDQSADFPQEEILFLGTLADLISGALHNAMTFQKAQEQAMTDGLTGLGSRRLFDESYLAECRKAKREEKPFSVVLLDLDGFKSVNDSLGHADGDAVLEQVGAIITLSCPLPNVACRYGGDEFVILMPDCDVNQARDFADRVHERILADPLLSQRKITPSVGIGSFPLHGLDPSEIVKVADHNMYSAKHKGGNMVVAPMSG
jgi:diguanylate cyclase (GGDEF)-like protein